MDELQRKFFALAELVLGVDVDVLDILRVVAGSNYEHIGRTYVIRWCSLVVPLFPHSMPYPLHFSIATSIDQPRHLPPAAHAASPYLIHDDLPPTHPSYPPAGHAQSFTRQNGI